MAFENLADKLSATFKKLRGKGRLHESDIKEAMRDVINRGEAMLREVERKTGLIARFGTEIYQGGEPDGV